MEFDFAYRIWLTELLRPLVLLLPKTKLVLEGSYLCSNRIALAGQDFPSSPPWL